MGGTNTSGTAVEAVAAALRAKGSTAEVIRLADDAPNAKTAAAALGCDVGAIANSLIFDADGEPILILTSGAHRVDTAHVAATAGLPPLKRAKPDFVVKHTGQRVGGVAPVGHPVGVRTFVDTWLKRHPQVWAAGGEAAYVFATTYTELVRLTDGTPIDVAAED